MPENSRQCGDDEVASGRNALPGAYAFFARYVLFPWESCLDVGGGLGVGRRILLGRSRHIRSIDVDTRLSRFGVEPGRIENEPDRSFDWVVAVDVVEHVEDDLGFLRHLWRVSRRGVYLTTPNAEHHPDLHWPYHVREYTCEQLGERIAREMNPLWVYHAGADVCCGAARLEHRNCKWEHQVVVASKCNRILTRTILGLREVVAKAVDWPRRGQIVPLATD